MDFGKPMLLVSRGDDLNRALALVRAVVDEISELVVVVCVPEPTLSLGEPDLSALERALEAGECDLAYLRERVPCRGEVLVGLPHDVLARTSSVYAPDVVVFGAGGEECAAAALEAARLHRVTSVCLGTAAIASPIRLLLHPFDGHADSLKAVGALVHDRCDATHRVIFLAVGALDPRLAEPSTLSTVLGVRARVDVLASGGLAAIATTASDAIVISGDGGGVARNLALDLALRMLARGPRPLIFAPRVGARPSREGELDAFDAVVRGDRLVLRVERLAMFGPPTAIADGPIELVAAGVRLGAMDARAGVIIAPRVLERERSLGLGRPTKGDVSDAVEVAVAVGPLGDGRIAIVDGRLDAGALGRIRHALEDHLVLLVRVRHDVAARELRARARGAGLGSFRVVDVRDLLDEGDPIDVPAEVAAVRLARAAARLRADGVAVDVVVTMEPGRARASGFSILAPHELAAEAIATNYVVPRRACSLRDSLDALTASEVVPGNRVRVDLDNAAARQRLLSLIDSAKTRVHAQWYIVEDDEITRTIEAALRDAAARGVEVRVLVDSLYSLHGSLGIENPLLSRLARVPGVTLRASRPIDHVPTIEELKQRDHRKLVIVDGARALVSGRNLGQAYYRGFSEAHVSLSSTYEALPWLDASIELEGPAARLLDASFLASWRDVGEDGFALVEAKAVGEIGARVIIHRGLADAYTLEAYRTLIETAHERLVVVNSFPLQFELQHALRDALARGVRVSMLVGRARPSHGDDVPFSGGAYHGIADTLVRARLSTLIAEGADVRELIVPAPEGWDPALGPVRPHVHAKVVCADGEVLAIGSANLDVTAGYWESEALVVIDQNVASVAQQLEELLAASSPIVADDPKWRQGAAVREWLGRVWPPLLA